MEDIIDDVTISVDNNKIAKRPEGWMRCYKIQKNCLRKKIFQCLMYFDAMKVPVSIGHFQVCFYGSPAILIDMKNVMTIVNRKLQ